MWKHLPRLRTLTDYWLHYFGLFREFTTEAQKCINNIVIKVAKAEKNEVVETLVLSVLFFG